MNPNLQITVGAAMLAFVVTFVVADELVLGGFDSWLPVIVAVGAAVGAASLAQGILRRLDRDRDDD